MANPVIYDIVTYLLLAFGIFFMVILFFLFIKFPSIPKFLGLLLTPRQETPEERHERHRREDREHDLRLAEMGQRSQIIINEEDERDYDYYPEYQSRGGIGDSVNDRIANDFWKSPSRKRKR